MASFRHCLMDFFFPLTCGFCGRRLAAHEEAAVCAGCRTAVTPPAGLICRRCGIPLPDGGEHCYACRTGGPHRCEAIRAAGVYDGLLRTAIHDFKYRNRDYLDRFLGELLLRTAETYPDVFSGVETAVPVPVHPLRRLLRGYNQSALLARRVAAGLSIPMEAGILRRTRMTLPQHALSRAARKENMKGSFAYAGAPGAVKGRTVLLIDDICTTGVTLEQAASVLKRHGASKVVALVVARD